MLGHPHDLIYRLVEQNEVQITKSEKIRYHFGSLNGFGVQFQRQWNDAFEEIYLGWFEKGELRLGQQINQTI